MKLFESVINNAIKESMSDIHITGEHPLVSRKHGDIQFNSSLKWTHQEIDDLARKLLTPCNWKNCGKKIRRPCYFHWQCRLRSTFSPRRGNKYGDPDSSG